MYRPGLDRRVQSPAARALPQLVPLAIAAALLLGSCAVGPAFLAPPSRAVATYPPTPLPSQTISPATTGGPSQSFQLGRDLPGEWWALYRSRHLNAQIHSAIASNANLQAAQATLGPAQQNGA